MSIIERVKKKVIERRDRLSEGKINSVSSPFRSFREDFLGIEQKKMYLVSSFTKGSKTQFTSFMFVYTPLLYAYYNRDKIRVKFFFYLWEETKEDFVQRLACHLIYRLSKESIEVSPTELMSTDNDNPVSQEVLDIMDSEEFLDIMSFFEEHSQFSDSTNPTGVYVECKDYAEKHGTTYTKEKTYKDDFGVEQKTEGFDYYVPEDEDEYRIIIIDHLSLVSQERGFTLKQSMDKVGEYGIILRDRYNFTPVIIQQQNTDNESMDAFKLQKLRPTVAGLADSKYSARNCNVMLGLFSPIKFDLREYLGYDISKFRDNIRFLEVVLNRGGQAGGIKALYFNGKVCDYKELPLPNSPEISKWHSWLENRRKKTVKTFFIKVKRIFNK